MVYTYYMWLKDFYKIPKVAKKSNHVENTSDNVYQANSNLSHELSSDDEVALQSPQFKPSTSQMQAIWQMYMPYIEGPKMDWTVNDSLYHRFLKWKIKCKTYWIVNWECYLKQKKIKKVVAWSGDFGIDQWYSWCLPQDELCLEMIWNKVEDFCKY